MQRKTAKLILLALVLSLLLGGCTQETLSLSAKSKLLSELRASYRAASLIAAVSYTQQLSDAQGTAHAQLCVAETFAGSAAAGELLLCDAPSLEVGGDYLVYLQENTQTGVYRLLRAGRWNKATDAALFDEAKLPLHELRDDIKELQSVISAPAETLYYGELSALMEAADAVFIGRVENAPVLTETSFREDSGTAIIEHARPAAIVPLRVYGSMKGELPYGASVSFVYAPAYAADLVDAATLTAYACNESDVPALGAGYAVFFLRKGPDAKQNYYFGVNPLQAHAALEEDMLICAQHNAALRPYATLPELLEALKSGL